jgi:ribosomal-protein-serine acetyltransferase
MFHFALAPELELRLLEDSDAEELYALVEANRGHLAPWLPWAAAQTLADTRAFLALTRRQLAENNGFQCAIVESGRIVGTIGFHRVDWVNRATSLGYWLAEDAQGKGTMTMAARALVDWAFQGWGLHRVEIRAAVQNARSRAVITRLGFREEGLLRQVERVGGGRYLDHVVYSVLDSEWGTTTAEPSKRPARRSARASSARSSG